MNKKHLALLVILLYTSCNIIEEVKHYEVVVIENRITGKTVIKNRPEVFISLFKNVTRYSVKPFTIAYYGIPHEKNSKGTFPPIAVTFKDGETANISYNTFFSFPKESGEVIDLYKVYGSRDNLIEEISETFIEETKLVAGEIKAEDAYVTPNFWNSLNKRIINQIENKGFKTPKFSHGYVRYEEDFWEALKKKLIEEAKRNEK